MRVNTKKKTCSYRHVGQGVGRKKINKEWTAGGEKRRGVNISDK